MGVQGKCLREHENVTPDILTAGKGLTGGYLPIAVTVTTDEIYNAFLGEYEEQKHFSMDIATQAIR